MAEMPPYDALRGIPRDVLWGLLDEHGTPPYRVTTYEYRWERAVATWKAVAAALTAAARGTTPATPRDTAPRWLAAVCRELLTNASRSSWQGGCFGDVRTLERLGLVAPEHDEPYVLALVCAAPGPAWLRADPDLLHGALWRVFEVEGGGEVSLTNVDKFVRRGQHAWQPTFVELVAAGDLPRDRVLRACLAALRRDFSAYRAGWYARLYDALTPSVDEQAAHQDDLRALVRSGVPATATWAVRKLRALGKAGLLDEAATVPALAPAVLSRVKGTALDAIRLLVACGAHGHDVVPVLTEALDHPDGEVQRAAVAALERAGAGAAARSRTESLPPSVAASYGAVPTAPEDAAPAPAVPVTPPPVSGDVLDRLAALLEDAGDAVEVEAVLAALAALADPSGLAPLRKRAATVLARGPREGVVGGWLRGHLATLVLLACGERPAQPLPADPVTAFLVARLGEVALVLAGERPPFTPLATPDDGWWVRPETLLRRLAQGPPRHHDLVAALLRLAPEGRVPGGEGAVAYALGADPPDLRRLRPRLPDPALWVAAARARDPLGPDPLLARAGLRGAGRADPLRASVSVAPVTFTSGGKEHTFQQWRVDVPGAVGDPPADQPTAPPVIPENRWWGRGYEDWTGWLATTWPHVADHFLVAAGGEVLSAADSTIVRHDVVRVLDALAVHPGARGPLTYAVYAAGLSAAKTDQRVRAVDGLLAYRPDPTLLADAMAALLPLCQPTRWARSLTEAAAAGAPRYVVVVLSALLPRLPYDTKGLHALVETLREESVRTGARPDGELRAWLAAFGGSSRAARAARELLA